MNKKYVGEQGNIILIVTDDITQDQLDAMVACDGIPTLPPLLDHTVVVRANKDEERVWAEYVKNIKTEEQIKQEALDAYTNELIEQGVM